MKYTVINADFASRLMHEVNCAISNGWVPLGGMCVDTSSSLRNETHFYQAMVKASGSERTQDGEHHRI